MKPSPSTSFPQTAPFQERAFLLLDKRFHRAIRLDPDIFVLGSAAVLAVFAFLGFNPQALAVIEAWVGADTTGSPSADWVNADNWAADAQPASGDSLIFISTNQQSTTTLTDSLTTTTSGSFR